MKIRKTAGDRLTFWCPACKNIHSVNSTWEFNGDLEKPTIKPSVRVTGGEFGIVCHSYVTDGEIKYLDDSTHDMAGQTVPLGELS